MSYLKAAPAKPVITGSRPRVAGKFLYVAEQKFYVRGVTYGTFRPGRNGYQYPDRKIVEQDFAQMSEHGINSVRTYTVPPCWLLDTAQELGLRVMINIPWEEHIAFLDERGRARDIERRVYESVMASAEHPAVLCYSIGNEIPASIVRWHGAQRVEKFLERICYAARAADPRALFTYVNYPTTEYLQLPFVDLLCFNVFLESPERFEAYVARLQRISGERPLIITEIGLDSRRHGEIPQADSLDWQIRKSFSSGAAGVFVFSWTDTWYRGGYDIEDWDFGLTRRERDPKPALTAVTRAFLDVPFPEATPWPRISVVVCSYNGARTIRDCLEGLSRLDYPDYEVIVVDDGSKDDTALISHDFRCRVISTENRGLSSARNTGMMAALGEIVAYIDDDAFPDPQWLKYIAAAFRDGRWAGVGGPNIAPPGDGWTADCVANAPGGPIPVLIDDEEAEHLTGCNMAFRKSDLERVGGFDTRFRTAGDDVDVCWRLERAGLRLGFSSAAVVWHHRRNSLRVYWRQQVGYGRAEALLERKWPGKYNAAGHVSWAGRLYGKGLTRLIGWSRGRVYQGIWGGAPFQRLYQPSPGLLQSLPLMPEWYLMIAVLAVLSALGTMWTPLLFTLVALALAVAAPVAQAALSAAQSSFLDAPQSIMTQAKLRGMTALLHLMQPLARLWGRVRYGLTPWRTRGRSGLCVPWPRTSVVWSEHWQSAEERLTRLGAAIREEGAVVLNGGNYDRWDLEVRGGTLGAVRVRMAIEEHGTGRQLVRFRCWPRYSSLGIILLILCAALFTGAVVDRAWVAAAVLGGMGLLIFLRTFYEGNIATRSFIEVLNQLGTKDG